MLQQGGGGRRGEAQDFSNLAGCALLLLQDIAVASQALNVGVGMKSASASAGVWHRLILRIEDKRPIAHKVIGGL
jgi:hypothetical protein